jgi:hypothetical protein
MLMHGRGGYRPVTTNLDAPFARDALQITKGRSFRPLAPITDDNDFDVEVIAHSLALKCRWGGMTAFANGEPLFYSVAQHAVHVADLTQMARRKLVPGWDWDNNPSPALYALHHDDAEGPFFDACRPIKPYIKGFEEIEARFQNSNLARLNVPLNMAIVEATRRVDNIMIFLERDALMGAPERPYGNEIDNPKLSIYDVIPDFRPWTPAEAKRRFIQKHEEIVAHDGNLIPLEYLNRGYGL